MEENTKPDFEKILRAACDFQAASLVSREATREAYRKLETNEENILRILIDGLIAKLANTITTKIETVDEKQSYQIGLITSFVRTHYLISDMVMCGDLIEAQTLIRKQLESLTRMHELDSKPLLKLLRKTPNVINVFQRAGKAVYPQLSEVAHFGTPRVAEFLHIFETEEINAPHLLPAFNKYALGCFDLNAFVAIYFIAWFIDKLKVFYKDYDAQEDSSTFVYIFKLAEDTGVIKVDKT